MNKDSIIYVAGHTGLVGSNLVKGLKEKGYTNILCTTRHEVDLTSQQSVYNFFNETKPEYVFLCAAMVGGIKANIDNPYPFLADNLSIELNIMNAAISVKAKKVLNLGSSCIYPKDYIQPLKEEYLLQAPLEPTNEGYALAKICGLKMAEYANKQYDTKFISLMPCNLYGPGDHYDLEKSHVLSALIKKIVDAKDNGVDIVEIWGSGTQRREFMYTPDLVNGMVWAMNNIDKTDTFLNIGTGVDISILELAHTIASIYGYEGNFVCNTDKPDGMKQKLLDVTKINELGWKATTTLEDGIFHSINDYLIQKDLI